MMVETGGVGNDPMDASEYEYNEKYLAEIKDPEISIDVGIHYLADCLSLANVTSPEDKGNLNRAIQGYDYHKEYIQWALEHFGGYSKANVKVYADHMKAQLNLFAYGDVDYVEHVLQYIGFDFGTIRSDPDFSNDAAWGYNNPYSRAGLYGQCTWFAWGRFYEIYGFDPGFTGDGWNFVDQLVKAHPDKFTKSNIPEVGSVFSCIGRNHVGIVIGWDGATITIQEGNLDGITNTFKEAQNDWRTISYEFKEFIEKYDGVVFSHLIE